MTEESSRNGIIEKVLQWLYATRNKKLRYRILVEIAVISLVVACLTLGLGGLEEALLKNYTGSGEVDFARIFSIVAGLAFLIIEVNWGTKQADYSEILLSYYYLRTYRKREKCKIVKAVVIPMIMIGIILLMSEEIDVIATACQWELGDTLVIGFVCMMLLIYIPMTEFVLNEKKMYIVKRNASVAIFLIGNILYVLTLNKIDYADMGTTGNVVLFVLGEIGLVESAISNHKNLYRKIKEERYEEVCRYLRNVDEAYVCKETEGLQKLDKMKELGKEARELWNKAERKQKQKIILSGVALAVLYVILIMGMKKIGIIG